MTSTNNCECIAAPKLVFACSGAADVGAVADQAARKLTRDGIGKMFCLAGIGGRISGILKNTEMAKAILAIDGCPLNCTKKCLEEAGIKSFNHIQLADMGMIKGQTELNETNIDLVSKQGAKCLEATCS